MDFNLNDSPKLFWDREGPRACYFCCYAQEPQTRQGVKSRPARVGTGSDPDTGFRASTVLGTSSLRPGLTERTGQISYPETALGRKEPMVCNPLGGQRVSRREMGA